MDERRRGKGEEAMAAGMVGSVGGGESIAVCFVVFEV